MLEVITSTLMFLMQPCYDLAQNWWLAILLFTALVKIILLPLSLWCQKNSIVMVQLMPQLNRIKVKYFGDTEAIGEAQTKLNKEMHYHPMLSLVPLVVQILILFGLVDVIHSITDNGFPGTEFLGAQPTVDGGAAWIMPFLAAGSAVIMGYAQNRINPLQREQSRAEKNVTNGLSIALSLFLGIFVAAGMCFYWICSNLTSIAVQALCNVIIKPARYIDYDDLAQSREELEQLEALGGVKRPWWKTWLKKDPLTAREKADYKRFMSIGGKHLVVYSEGNAFYKYFQGALEYVMQHSTCPIHYVTSDPNDQVFDLAKTQPLLLPYYIGPKRAITLFMKMEADVVAMTLEDLDSFYMKRSYVRQDIEYVFFFHHMLSTHLTPLAASYDHYDTLLCVGPHQVAEVRRREEIAGLPPKHLVECGYDLLDREIASYQALATQPSLRPSPSSSVDTIEPSSTDGVGETELHSEASQPSLRSTSPAPSTIKNVRITSTKAMGEEGWSEGCAASVRNLSSPITSVSAKTVLIAPSWQEDNILDLCIDELLKQLVSLGVRIIVRPHPEYVKRFKPRWEALQERWKHLDDVRLHFESDFSSSESIYTSNVLITDWSSISCEFSFSTLKPCVFINTPMKERNSSWRDWGITPTDITLRDEIGISFDLDALESVSPAVTDMILQPEKWSERIRVVRDGFIFNLGHGGEVAGEYLLSAVLEKQKLRKDPSEKLKKN